jgi:arylamine N-acetyltransferase
LAGFLLNGRNFQLLRPVKGDDALRIFARHYRIETPQTAGEGPAAGLLEAVVRDFSRLPYENISKIIKSADREGPLERFRLPLEVVADHVEKGFGGTCFSLTFLLERMLRSLGFDCHKVMAHMHMGENVHCLVVVNRDGRRYMIDPGYALHAVMELPGRGSTVVRCPHAVVEISLDESGFYSLHTADAAGRKWRYRFRDVPVGDEEFEQHWVESFDMPTLRNVCLGRITEKGHLYLRKDYFKFASRDDVDKRRLRHGVDRVIEEEFGIDRKWVGMAWDVLEARRR